MERGAELQVLKSVEKEMNQIPGHLGMYYKNLVTGFEYSVRGDEAFLAASVIKFPLFLHLLKCNASGDVDLNEKIKVLEEDKVPICGALTLFTGEVETDLRTLCRLMISISDNTATNVLIKYCGIDALNRSFQEMGMEKTVLRRRLYDSKASAAGIQNTICPKEMGMLLEKLYRNEFASPDACQEAMDTLMLQQVNHKLDGKVNGAVDIAHKTGEDDQLSNDVGIVFAPQPFVICFAGHDTDVYHWEDLIRRSTYDLVAVQGDINQ